MLKKPASSALEDESFVAVARVVHEMGFQWRRTSPDNSGFDGEIEIVKPGGIMSARIIRCQVKAGESYRTSENATELRIRIEQKYWEHWQGSNTPVALVYYDPRDQGMYWMDVLAYLERNPELLQTGRDTVTVSFDKVNGRLNAEARSSVAGLVEPGRTESAPRRSIRPEPRSSAESNRTELVRTNWLPVEDLPDLVYYKGAVVNSVDQVLYEFRERHPLIVRERRIWTFANLLQPDSPFGRYASGLDAGSLPTGELRHEYLVELLHCCLHARLIALGCIPAGRRREIHRYTFRTSDASSGEKYHYVSLRGIATSRKLVKNTTVNKKPMVQRLAVEVSFRALGGTLFLEVDPFWDFRAAQTYRDAARSAVTSCRQNTYNEDYLHLVNFWEEFLSSGDDVIRVPCDADDAKPAVTLARRTHLQTAIPAEADYVPPKGL